MPAPVCSRVRVRLRFRCVEYHTFEREIDQSEIDEFEEDGDLFDYLHSKFQDDNGGDSDIETDSYELDRFETLDPENTKPMEG